MAKNLNLINILFVIIIFPVLSFLVKDYLVYRYAVVDVPAFKAVSPAPVSAPDISSYAPVVERSVFAPGPLKFRSLVVMDSGANAQGSPLSGSISLIGTYMGPVGFAILENKSDSVEKTFKVGDNVFGTGVLKEVYKDRVVISSGGTDYSLVMLIETPPPSAARQDETVPAARPSSSKDAARKPAFSPEGVRKTGERDWVIDQKAVLHALDNIDQVLSDARLTPVSSKGAVEGFLVNEVKPKGIFDTIGLKNGDILKRVNGFEVTSPERAVQVLTGLRGETKIDLDIVRGGQKMNFHYEVR